MDGIYFSRNEEVHMTLKIPIIINIRGFQV